MADARNISLGRAVRPSFARWAVLLSLTVLSLVGLGAALAATTAPGDAAPAERRFKVYFGHDAADLTKEASEVVEQAITYRQAIAGRILVVGYADRLGDPTHNLLLSKKRARAVGRSLLAHGLRGGLITVRWMGENTPPNPTDDEMREPLNRCAELVVTP